MYCMNCGAELGGGSALCAQCKQGQGQAGAGLQGSPSWMSAGEPLSPRAPQVQTRDDIGNVTFWGLFGAFFAVAYIASSTDALSGDIAGHVGYALGSMAVVPLVVALVAKFSGRAWRRAFVITAAICTFITLVNATTWVARGPAASAKQEQDLHAAATELQSTMHGMPSNQEAVTSTGGQPRPLNPGEAASGRLGLSGTDTVALQDFLQSIQPVVASYAAREKEDLAKMNALHIERILRPTELVTAGGVANGRAMMQQYMAIIEAEYRGYQDYVVAMRERINQLKEPLRTHIMAGYAASELQMSPAMKNYMSVERDLNATAESLFDLAEANIGRSRAVNNTIYLPPDALERYKVLISQLQAQAHAEGEARTQVLRLKSDAMSKIDDFTNMTQ